MDPKDKQKTVLEQIDSKFLEVKKALETEIVTLRTSVEEGTNKIKALEADAKVAKEKEMGAGKISGLEEELKKRTPQLSKYISARKQGWDMGNSGVGFENEIQSQFEKSADYASRYSPLLQGSGIIEKASQNAGSGSAGGFALAPQLTAVVLNTRMAQMPMFRAGAIQQSVNGYGEVWVPKVTSKPTVSQIAEGGTIPTTTIDWDQEQSKPKMAGSIVRLSGWLAPMGGNRITTVVEQLLAEQIPEQLNNMGLVGTGVGNQPLGILNRTADMTTSTVSLGTDGGRFKYAHANQMENDLDDAGFLMEGRKYTYMMNSRVKYGLSTEYSPQFSGQADIDGIPKNQLMVLSSLEKISQTLGYNVITSLLVPKNITTGATATTSKVVFGPFDEITYYLWTTLLIDMNPYANVDGVSGYQTYTDSIRGIQLYNLGMGKSKAFTVATGCKTVF